MTCIFCLLLCAFLLFCCWANANTEIPLLTRYQNKIEVRLDEGKTTASDYTILVSNPPGDAVDPEEWKEFFNKVLEKVDGKQQQKVTLCTIALGNHR